MSKTCAYLYSHGIGESDGRVGAISQLEGIRIRGDALRHFVRTITFFLANADGILLIVELSAALEIVAGNGVAHSGVILRASVGRPKRHSLN